MHNYVSQSMADPLRSQRSVSGRFKLGEQQGPSFILRLHWDHCPLAWGVSFLLSNNLRVIIGSDPAHATLNYGICLLILVDKIFNHKDHPKFTHSEH